MLALFALRLYPLAYSAVVVIEIGAEHMPSVTLGYEIEIVVFLRCKRGFE